MRRAHVLAFAAALALATAGCDDDDGPSGASLAVTCSANPTSGRVPLVVQYTASATGGGGDYAYSWSFGDGAAASEASITRTFTQAGTFSATVEVRSGGQRGSCNVSVTAQPVPAPTLAPNSAPTAVFKINPSPPTGPAVLEVDFNACQSTDPDGDRLLFKFDTGEGSSEQGHCRKTHRYRTPGTYNARVCVTDDFPGRQDICQSYTIRVH
jgi:PKD repeat protein